MTAYVYILKSSSTGNYYIGSTSDLDKRLLAHQRQFLSGVHHNKKFQALWDQFKDIGVSAVSEVLSLEAAQKLEETLIKQFIKDPLCVNIGTSAVGGDNYTHHPDKLQIRERIVASFVQTLEAMGEEERVAKYGKFGERNGMYGRTHTEEVKQRLSENRMGISPANKGQAMSLVQRQLLSEVGKTRIGEKNAFYGKQHSEETKEKLRKSSLGRDNGTGHSVEVNGVVYGSYGLASKALSIPLVTIRHRCLSNNPKFSGYKLLQSRPTTIESTAG